MDVRRNSLRIRSATFDRLITSLLRVSAGAKSVGRAVVLWGVAAPFSVLDFLLLRHNIRCVLDVLSVQSTSLE